MATQSMRRLAWLGDNPRSWGGHMDRGEPVTDPEMADWIERGLIEYQPSAVGWGTGGYILTAKGRSLVASFPA